MKKSYQYNLGDSVINLKDTFQKTPIACTIVGINITSTSPFPMFLTQVASPAFGWGLSDSIYTQQLRSTKWRLLSSVSPDSAYKYWFADGEYLMPNYIQDIKDGKIKLLKDYSIQALEKAFFSQDPDLRKFAIDIIESQIFKT